MFTSVVICVVAFFGLLIIIRKDSISLGLPLAYLFSLLLIHVPGAYAYLMDDQLPGASFVEIGIRFAAIGSLSYVAGVWAVSLFSTPTPAGSQIDRRQFALFCLVGGWLFTFGLSFLHSVPSLGAVVEKAGAVWTLGVMFGLRLSIAQANPIKAALWGVALLVYPLIILVLGGFLSFGAAVVIPVLSVLLVSVRSHFKVTIGLIVGVYIAMSVFVNYFAHRDNIRAAAWGGAPLVDRIDATLKILDSFEWFSSSNHRHMIALTERLNQNYFAGLSDARIKNGDVDYLYGRSLWEGLISLVPRALWPNKPVFAGSPKIVAEMTGLTVNEQTSFGVGNVMEFDINFGIPGLICGFFVLGALIRILDRAAALADRRGDFGTTILCFLPAVALIAPNGSIIELCSGSAAAWIGGIGWKWAWELWSTGRTRGGHRSKVHHTVPGTLRPSRE